MLLKFVPEIITVAPTAPLPGLKPDMDGVGNTVKLKELFIVTPLVVTDIGPVTAPAGTKVVILVALEDITDADVPLKNTDGDGLKLVPEIITVAPTAPLVGLVFVMVGVGSTVKFEEDVTVTPLNVKEINPVVAPTGTVVVMEVVVEALTVAGVPLKLIMFSTGLVLKFVPVMVTVAPTAPVEGAKPVIDGDAKTVKLSTLVMVTPLVVTEIGPGPAPDGTVVVMLVALEEVTTAIIPLKSTVGAGPKFVPVTITVAPIAPLVGLKLVIVGVGSTVKFEGLETVTPFKVNVTRPVVAPAGTEVVNFLPLGSDMVTTAGVPLNRTALSESVVLKFVPFI